MQRMMDPVPGRLGEHNESARCGEFGCSPVGDVPVVDAWKQLDDLRRKFCRTWEVREDLVVDADGIECQVLINDVSHNVITTREYIAVLQAACDLVEAANPEWAAHDPSRSITPDDYETWPNQRNETKVQRAMRLLASPAVPIKGVE